MTNQEQFNRSVSALVKAFFEGSLEAFSCAACACGNLIAAANNLTVVPASRASFLGPKRFMWAEFAELIESRPNARDPHNIWDSGSTLPNADQLIAATGYTPDQLCMVEDAFMGWNAGGEFGSNFDGLLRVVDVLADIHGIDLASAEAAKGLFVKVAA